MKLLLSLGSVSQLLVTFIIGIVFDCLPRKIFNSLSGIQNPSFPSNRVEFVSVFDLESELFRDVNF